MTDATDATDERSTSLDDLDVDDDVLREQDEPAHRPTAEAKGSARGLHERKQRRRADADVGTRREGEASQRHVPGGGRGREMEDAREVEDIEGRARRRVGRHGLRSDEGEGGGEGNAGGEGGGSARRRVGRDGLRSAEGARSVDERRLELQEALEERGGAWVRVRVRVGVGQAVTERWVGPRGERGDERAGQ